MLTTSHNYSNAYSNRPVMPFFADDNSKASFSSDQNLQNAYLHATLEQIDQLANEDVEMQAPLSEFAIFIVVDTNIILHHFEVLSQFVEDVERLSLPMIVIVPGAVIHELDGQKKRDGLAWFARRGSAWLLEKVRERKYVKGQAQEETCKSTGNWKIRERGEISSPAMYNDGLILDCCMFFSRERHTFLCSADNNLCINSQVQGIPIITPSRYWSSRELAYSIYGDRVDLSQFAGHKESYTNPESEKEATAAARVDDDDLMKVDEDSTDSWKSENPVNMLHEAVIDHFSRLLVELVGKVGGSEVRQRTMAAEEANMSHHAPRRRHYTEWTASECLEYLNGRKRVKAANPRAEVFLLRPRAGPGARPGREWSRKDWEVALGNLKETGKAWGDVSIGESLFFLQPHIERVFSMALRV